MNLSSLTNRVLSACSRRTWQNATLARAYSVATVQSHDDEGPPPVHLLPQMNPAEWRREQLRPRLGTLGPRYIRPPVATLDPLRLRPSDCIDISGILRPSINVSPLCRLTFYKSVPFPPNTRGFLYYHSPSPGIDPLAGEVRFRLVENGDPDYFGRGSDLMSPTGIPWSILFLKCIYKRYQGLRNTALHNGLITPSLWKKCNLVDEYRTRPPIIHSLGQPFPVKFSHYLIVRTLADNLNAVKIGSLFRDQRSNLGHSVQFPYTGRGLLCFERSPFNYHEGKRTIVLRILKITEPVTCVIPKYDGHTPKPIEGELVRIRTYQRKERPWWCDVDETCKSLESLKYLIPSPNKAH